MWRGLFSQRRAAVKVVTFRQVTYEGYDVSNLIDYFILIYMKKMDLIGRIALTSLC
jgi:hypothetical protein